MTSYSATPFRHWIVDDFLPAEMAEDAHTYFFDGEGEWTRRHHLYSRHKETRTSQLAWPVEQALRRLESEEMRVYLQQLTGIGPLFSDAERFGGGQHVIWSRGKLGIHADFTHHPRTMQRRALNLLLYLNKDKQEGGWLELWDKEMRACQVRIEPTFNRAVIFATSTTSYHGHPDPLPRGPRCSLAVYYYVNNPLGGWLPTTDYRPRPHERLLRLRRRLRILLKGR